MKAKIELTLKPFRTPNFVIIDSNDGENRTIPLSALDSNILYKMCEDFKSEIFRKAGKELPPQADSHHPT